MFVVVQKRGERCVEGDFAQLDTRLVGLETRDCADEVDDAGAGPAAVEEAERTLDVRAPERMPLAGDADERLFGGSELRELLLREDRVSRLRAASRTAPARSGRGSRSRGAQAGSRP